MALAVLPLTSTATATRSRMNLNCWAWITPLCKRSWGRGGGYGGAGDGGRGLGPERRRGLLAQAVEPALQRELQHKGAANGDGSYSAELIAYAEINSGGRG